MRVECVISDAPEVMRLGEGHAKEVRKAADTETDQAAPAKSAPARHAEWMAQGRGTAGNPRDQ